MIVQERLIHDGTEFIKTYSDAGFTIRQIETGNIYGEAIDLAIYPKEYEETDELIEAEEPEDMEEETDADIESN